MNSMSFTGLYKGFGAYCGKEWCYGRWDEAFCDGRNELPSIEYLELFAVTVGVLKWIKLFKDQTIHLYCDNRSVCDMINDTAGKCKNTMVLLRFIVLEGMVHNVNIRAEWVKTDEKGKADALSRFQFGRFRELDDSMNDFPEEIPSQIWPISKIALLWAEVVSI